MLDANARQLEGISVSGTPPSSLYAKELLDGLCRRIVKPRYEGPNGLAFSWIDSRERHHHD